MLMLKGMAAQSLRSGPYGLHLPLGGAPNVLRNVRRKGMLEVLQTAFVSGRGLLQDFEIALGTDALL